MNYFRSISKSVSVKTTISKLTIAASLLLLAVPKTAQAHPHVFAEARLEISVSPDKLISQVAHVWRFDDVFSSTVLMEFDKDGDLQLNQAELDDLSQTISSSISEYKYFQNVMSDGVEIEMQKPEHIIADFPDNQLLLIFASSPAAPLQLKPGHVVSVGVYDPTFYTAIDYLKDEDLQITGLAEGCSSKVVRPDPDEAIAQNQASLTEAFFQEEGTHDLSKLFATRIEISC